ncbi:MAG: N-acetylmuramoyl-L-alanine amidase [Bacillota bacterium]
MLRRGVLVVLVRKSIFVFALLAVGLIVVLTTGRTAGAAAKIAVVQGDVVNLRSGPGTNYQITAKVTRGTRLEVLGQSGGWYKIAYAGGKTSWVAGWLVKLEGQTPATPPAPAQPAPPAVGGKQVAVVQGDVVNLRSGPGTNYQITAKVTRGTRLEVLGQSGGWYKIAYAGGKTSWVAGWLVAVETVPSPPVHPPQRGEGRPVFELATRVGADKVILEIRAVAPFTYEIFTLGSPDRLVVDLTGLPDGDLPPPVDPASGLVKKVRAGWSQRDPLVARVTCELSVSVDRVRHNETRRSDGKVLELEIVAPGEAAETRKVFLDPGHGGSDPGAIGPAGIKEKEVNLAVALECARLLREQGFEVVLSRDADYYLDLYERTEMANREGATIFVSIHANANPDPSKQGTSTYYYAPADDPLLAPQAGQRARLARCLQDALVASVGRPDLGLYQARFAVLRTAAMPSALVEIAFLSNPEEERLLGEEWFQRQAARGIVQGIINYFGEE